MAAETVTLANLKDKAGMELEPLVIEIEKGMVKRFTEALGDDNPKWQEEAPPTMALTLGFGQIQQILMSDPALTALHGSTELECQQPLHVGDVITVGTRIAKVRQRQGKMGETVFATFEITCQNQRQELVAKCSQLAIIY